MLSINNTLLYNIIIRKRDFCCLCCKTIDGTPISFEDDVVLEENSLQSSIKIQDILLLVLGYDVLRDVSTYEAICKQCSHEAVNCYKFILKSKQNIELLRKMLTSLTSCLENTSIAVNNSKALFVSVDTNNFTTQQYYDQKSASSCSIALERLQGILDGKTKQKKDPEPITIESANNYGQTMKTFKKRRKYLSLPIKTKEMLYDSKDSATLRCKECYKLYPSLAGLRNHYIRVHAPKHYGCPICHRKFGSVAILDLHKNESHCKLVCSECGKTFYNRHTLKMHEIGHHFKIVCEDCGRVYKTQTTFKKHIELNVCGQKTRASPADAKFTCDHCNKKYTQKVSLRVHMQYEHGNLKSHDCKWCNKKFYAQSKLKAHILKHTQEKNFSCDMCGGKFTTKESLLYHTRTHTGEKPYKCDYCDSRFISASRRSHHAKRAHANIIFKRSQIQNEEF